MNKTFLPLAKVIALYRSGEGDTLLREFEHLENDHANAEGLAELETDIQANGILEPIILGSDGRVWNGHHRLCVAHRLKLKDVPVVYAGKNVRFDMKLNALMTAHALDKVENFLFAIDNIYAVAQELPLPYKGLATMIGSLRHDWAGAASYLSTVRELARQDEESAGRMEDE